MCSSTQDAGNCHVRFLEGRARDGVRQLGHIVNEPTQITPELKRWFASTPRMSCLLTTRPWP
jgi:hypothetical protein